METKKNNKIIFAKLQVKKTSFFIQMQPTLAVKDLFIMDPNYYRKKLSSAMNSPTPNPNMMWTKTVSPKLVIIMSFFNIYLLEVSLWQ